LSLSILLLLFGSVHPNPGPRQSYLSISVIAFQHKFDLFAFTETWLNPNVPNDSILISGYNAPLRKDRLTSRGGGVALYVGEHLQAIRRLDFESNANELLWAEIKVGCLKLLCGVFYRPPNQCAEAIDEFFTCFQESLDGIELRVRHSMHNFKFQSFSIARLKKVVFYVHIWPNDATVRHQQKAY
jgi:hypothetical protein